MEPKDEFDRMVNMVVTEIHELEEEIDLVPEMITKQLDEPAFEFRPLTEEEKKEFIESLDDNGRQILAELEGRSKKSSDSVPLLPSPTTAL